MNGPTEHFDIEAHYQITIDKVRQGKRPLRLYTPQESLSIYNQLENSLTEPELDQEFLKKVLCLLDFGQAHGQNFSPLITKLLKAELPQEIRIFTLSVSSKWVVEYHQKLGNRLDQDFQQAIHHILLHEKEFEVLEWALRVVETCGNQSMIFKQSIETILPKVKPKFLRRTSVAQQNCYEIILILQDRWQQLYGKIQK